MVYHVIQSDILERGRFNATKIVLWCNGNTSDFGSEIPSSNLGRTTIIDNHDRDINATNRWFGDTVSPAGYLYYIVNFNNKTTYFIWPFRLMVRTRDFHSRNQSSNLC